MSGEFKNVDNFDSDKAFKSYFGNCISTAYTDQSDPYEVLDSLRNATVCLHKESMKRLNNESALQLLRHNTSHYLHVANKDGKHRYAELLKTLIKNNNTDISHCRQWKSSIRSSGVNVENLIKEQLEKTGDRIVKNFTPCKSSQISDENLNNFIQKVPSRYNEKKSNVLAISERGEKPFKIGNLKRSLSSEQIKPACSGNPTFSPKIPKSLPSNNNKSSTNFPTRNKNFIENNETPRNPTNYNRPNDHTDLNKSEPNNVFKTARAELMIQNVKKYGNSHHNHPELREAPVQKKSLGTTRSMQSKFIPPMMNNDSNRNVQESMDSEEFEDERLKHIDPKMVELIRSEIIDSGAPIGWNDIAGLDFAKTAIQEAVVWPLLRPDIFTGLRRPPRGILLFGPPGTGKTLIGKCVASQCNATFFSISASSLTSKWIGDGEKMVRALFAVARCHQPAVVFIDEIDSLLTQRSDSEHEATRRIKTEFLVQLDGAATSDEDKLLLIGATNRPQELDEAARRRLVKRLYIPLPDLAARKQLINRLMSSEKNSLTEEQIDNISEMTDGYSGADMRCLCGEAALGPIRSVPLSQISSIHTEEVRPVNMEDFRSALERVRPSVSKDDLEQYIKWDATYGSGKNLL